MKMLSDNEKKLKLKMLDRLKEELMGDVTDPAMEKMAVTVAADDEEDLQEGLSKAQELVAEEDLMDEDEEDDLDEDALASMSREELLDLVKKLK